jgi:hypothetical protein
MQFFYDSIDDRLRALVNSATKVIYLISPFIKLYALKNILERVGEGVQISIITNWDTRSVLQGDTDIEVFPYIKERGGVLYANQNLHAKCLIADMRNAVVMTSNITGKGLGLRQKANQECAVEINLSSAIFCTWIYRLLEGSVEINESLYGRITRFCEANQQVISHDTVSLAFDPFTIENSRHLSNLPYSPSPDIFLNRLTQVKNETFSEMDPIEIQELIHDLHLLGVNFDQTATHQKLQLKKAFFSLSYVNQFLNFLGDGKYFGESKKWLQTSCNDMPCPRRKSLTRYVASLFKWVEDLSDGRYKRHRPNFSEYLEKVPV